MEKDLLELTIDEKRTIVVGENKIEVKIEFNQIANMLSFIYKFKKANLVLHKVLKNDLDYSKVVNETLENIKKQIEGEKHDKN